MRKIIIILCCWLVTSAYAQEPNPQTTTTDPLQLLSEVRKDLSGLEAAFVQYELIDGSEKVDPTQVGFGCSRLISFGGITLTRLSS